MSKETTKNIKSQEKQQNKNNNDNSTKKVGNESVNSGKTKGGKPIKK